MKALIVFYSRTGNTRKVAHAIAESLRDSGGAEVTLEEIVDKKKRSGLIGWLRAGRDATLKRPTEIEETKADVSAFDLVIVGTPVWAWTATPAVGTFLKRFAEAVDRAAFFCTYGTSGAGSTFNKMKDILGKEPVATLALTARQVKKEHPEDYAAKIEGFAAGLARALSGDG